MKKMIALGIFLSLLTTGCASSWWGVKYGKEKPHISFVQTPSGEVKDRLYVWNPNHNAAYIFDGSNGKIAACLASADVAKSRDFEASLNLDVGKILDKIESGKVDSTLKSIEKLTKLSEKKEAASYLNVAMFHICMLAGADKISQQQAATLMQKAIEHSATLLKK
ncbi:hypothetical protein CW749_19320 [Vibrio sp. vnigr-6D03]|uniref:hypothetical protein n=1 Tax=Vibrio sp. vnigr-6D03 TaxID=2058088 RepID=UPI000C33C997|nr:hypothetical protein [Vibrio sp. vnigr-6D03]PKF77884.1 hypothetical protein CW749_19320 [Vibrio sp. vnigr-6D03]